MPVKKTKAAASAKASKTSAMPKASLPKKPRFLPPQPLQVETQIATATTPTLLLGVGMICAVLVGVAFGASLLNAAASVARTFYGESNESKNVFDVSRIRNYEEYKRLYSDASKAKFFNVNVKSKAVLGNKSFTDQCFKDTCDSSGRCVSKAVTSCLPSDKNCYLKEGFIIATPLKLGSWEYDCQFGCKNGACVKPPVCTDSDLNSNTGQSDPFMKGFTKGMGANGQILNVTDFCTQSNVWPATSSTPTGPSVVEWYCKDGIVNQVLVGCDSGCIDGACSNGLTIGLDLTSGMPSQYVLGNKSYPKVVTYQFTTKNSGVVIDEVSFEIFGTSVEAGDQPVKNLTFNGKTGIVVNNRVKFSNLNLSIPASYAGKNLTVGLTVNKAGIGGISSGNDFAVIIENVKWHDGYGVRNLGTNLGSAKLFPVASLPVITLNSLNNKLSAGSVRLFSFNIVTEYGAVLIKKIPFKFSKSAGVTIDKTKFVLKNSDGTVVATGYNATDDSVDFIINGGYAVSTGAHTLNLYAEVTNISGVGNYIVAGLNPGNKSNFIWDSVTGGVAGLTGSLLYGYPTDMTTITD